MERRYLVATLAIIATFTVFSRGFRSLQHVSLLHAQQLGAIAGEKCNSDLSAFSQWAARARERLRPARAEEAQMLAELNIPIAAVQARVAEQAVRQSMAATRCAREMAMREAERAQRDAMRSRAKMARGSSQPISFAPSLPDDFGQRMEFQTAVLADRLAARTVSLQLAADKFEEVSQQADAADLADFAVDAEHDAINSGSQTRCRSSQSWQERAERAVREAGRSVLQEVEHVWQSM